MAVSASSTLRPATTRSAIGTTGAAGTDPASGGWLGLAPGVAMSSYLYDDTGPGTDWRKRPDPPPRWRATTRRLPAAKQPTCERMLRAGRSFWQGTGNVRVEAAAGFTAEEGVGWEGRRQFGSGRKSQAGGTV